jgi:hypothetical protein
MSLKPIEKLLHELPVGWGEHECNEKNCDQKLSIKINELIEVVNEQSEIIRSLTSIVVRELNIRKDELTKSILDNLTPKNGYKNNPYDL